MRVMRRKTGMIFDGFRNGINLGGWFSQYEFQVDQSDLSEVEQHLNDFIQEDDIARISEWGFDHVRIPVSGCLLYDREHGKLSQMPMQYFDRAISWCRDRHLNVVVDLHYFWGYVYGAMDRPTAMLTDMKIRKDFICFWQSMAAHMKGYEGIEIAFEIFNEIADSTGYLWNSLYKEAIRAIRREDNTRCIIVGSNFANSVGYLDRLDLMDDPLVSYTFHFYEPNVFTHQKASFSDEFSAHYCHTMTYPGDMTEYQKFLADNPKYLAEHPLITRAFCNDLEYMKHLLHYADDFLNYSGKELYCGEFGVIDSAPEKDAVKWLDDFIGQCDTMKIGHAMWNYKYLNFGILGNNGEVLRPGVLSLMQKIGR